MARYWVRPRQFATVVGFGQQRRVFTKSREVAATELAVPLLKLDAGRLHGSVATHVAELALRGRVGLPKASLRKAVAIAWDWLLTAKWRPIPVEVRPTSKQRTAAKRRARDRVPSFIQTKRARSLRWVWERRGPGAKSVEPKQVA
jgi:hypothetical protein